MRLVLLWAYLQNPEALVQNRLGVREVVSDGEECPAKVGLQEEVGLGVRTVKGEGVHWDG